MPPTPTVAELRIGTLTSVTGKANFNRNEYVVLHAFEREIAQSLKDQGVKTLCYMNGAFVAGYQAGMAHGFNLDYNYMTTSHPEWFVHKSGARIENPYFPNVWLLNQHLTSYQNEWKAYVLGELDDGMWSGVMCDDTNFNSAGIAPYPYDECANRETYEEHTRLFLANVGVAIQAAGYLFIPNVQHQWPYMNYSLRAWLPYISGVLIENYCKWDTRDPNTGWHADNTLSGGPNDWVDEDQIYMQWIMQADVVFTPTVLDNFNRADEGPPIASLNADWKVKTGVGLSVVSNQFKSYYQGTHGSYWDIGSYAYPFGICVTLAALGENVNNDYIQLFLTTDPAGTTANGYSMALTTQGIPAWPTEHQRIRIFRHDAGVGTQLFSQQAGEPFQVGDKLGFYYDQDELQVWKYSPATGKWLNLALVTDTTHAALTGIKPAITLFHNPTWKLDDFASIVPTSTPSTKLALPLTYGFTEWANVQMYARASFYIAWNGVAGSAFMYEIVPPAVDPYLAREWRIALGSPAAKKKQHGQAWSRKYTGGIAIVNPSSTNSENVPLDQTYYTPGRVAVSGTLAMPPISGMLLTTTPIGYEYSRTITDVATTFIDGGIERELTITTGSFRTDIDAARIGIANFARNRVIVLNPWERTLAEKLRVQGVRTLMYKCAASTRSYHTGLYPPAGIPWSYANSTHPEWFTHKSGARFTWSGFANTWQMNLGMTTYQDQWATNVLAELDDGMWDGVFVDNANMDPNFYKPLPYDEYASVAAYTAATRAFLANVGPKIRNAGYLIYPNIQHTWPLANDVWRDWLQFLSGAVLENYTKWDTGDPTTGHHGDNSWEDIDQIYMRWTMEAGKDFIGQLSGKLGDTRSQLYARASFLMEWDGRPGSVLCFTPQPVDDPYIATAWTTDLGAPISAKSAVGTVWTRQFGSGLVLVNPSSTNTQAVPLAQSYYGIDGAFVSVSVSVAPMTGVMLFNERPPIWSPWVNIAQRSTVSYEDDGLVAGRNYEYRVVAIDQAGNVSSFSPVRGAATGVGSAIDLTRVVRATSDQVIAHSDVAARPPRTISKTLTQAAATFSVTLRRAELYVIPLTSAGLTMSESMTVFKGGFIMTGITDTGLAITESVTSSGGAPFAMAVLDNFNRANQGPQPSTSWSLASGSGLVVRSNGVGAPSSGYHGSYWNPVSYSPPVGAAATIAAAGTDGVDHMGLTIHATPTGAADGYEIEFKFQSGNDRLIIWKKVAGSSSQIGATNTSYAFAVGDVFAIYYTGSIVQIWRRVGGTWTKIFEVADSTHSSLTGIRAGVYIENANTLLDDFTKLG